MKAVILKTILPLSLILALSAPALAASNSAANAGRTNAAGVGFKISDQLDISQINTGVTSADANLTADANPRYIMATGVITSIDTINETARITVDTQDGDTVIYNVNNDTRLYSLNSTEKMKFSNLAVGNYISVFYNVMTPVTLSIPAQLSPEVIVRHDNEKPVFVKVDYFDENSLSSDAQIRLNAYDSVMVVNENSQMLKFADTLNKNLLVFYTQETNQSITVKIVVLSSDVNEFNGNTITGEIQATEKPVTEELITEIPIAEEPQTGNIENIISALASDEVINIDGVRYIALAKTARNLGYTVDWNPDTALITLTRDNASFTLTPGQLSYGYNRSQRYFTNAPIIRNDRTFVEDSFLTLFQ